MIIKQKQNNEKSTKFMDDDYEIIQKVFVILKMPYDANINNSELKQTLRWRQRKNGIQKDQ